jgi:hypothetical protein
MAHTLRDQVVAARAARNEALRRMHQAIARYQEAVVRIAELEEQVATLQIALERATEMPAPTACPWYDEGSQALEVGGSRVGGGPHGS